MFKSIINSSINSLKLKLTCIYILNALDIVFTFTLLKTKMFYEANALMIDIVNNASLSILVKLFLPALLIIYIISRLDTPHRVNTKICNFLICSVLFLYLGIDLLHVYYIYTYIFS